MICVIKHGCPVENGYKIICSRCGCEFRFDKYDVTIRPDTFDFVEWTNHYYIHCPDCRHEMYLGDKL